MQTFFPFSNFQDSAEVLDNKRLNKQILECYQILKVLSNKDPKAAWRNHPAVLMWKGHEGRLYQYTMAMVDEANYRGIKTDKNVANLQELFNKFSEDWSFEPTEWEGNDSQLYRVMWTHRANLFTKDSMYYAEFQSAINNENNIPCCDKCKYYWVTHAGR